VHRELTVAPRRDKRAKIEEDDSSHSLQMYLKPILVADWISFFIVSVFAFVTLVGGALENL
jgi:hypothetical protein